MTPTNTPAPRGGTKEGLDGAESFSEKQESV
jgi:hypothetical protein